MNMCFRRRALTNASSTDPSEADKKFKVFLNVDTLAHRLTMSEKNPKLVSGYNIVSE
eukprot:m.59971 g.59971  ORF g.59971 m.59971 type:complete len:57 (+) comp11284_c0_seq3:948-1118(+)